MKSDGDLVSLPLPGQAAGLPYLTSCFTSCGLDSLTDPNSMVPCKQPPSAPSSPSFPRYKESDSNGNDIRGDKNMKSDNSICGSEDGEKTDVTQLTSQVSELQHSLSSLQQETHSTITKLRQELADKATIVETLQQQIRMKMFLNMTKQQQPSPVMAALADMQGPCVPGLEQGPPPTEDMLASWRKSLEQSLLAGFPFPLDQPRGPLASPLSNRSITPHHDRQMLMDNHNRSKTPSEDGRGSPGSSESQSPRKLDDGVSPTPSPVPGFPMGKAFPPSSPLSIPPHFTSRIPKGDPLEERLHDMLRYNMEKFAGQPIDTLADSRRVRELLSVHNIGQRLFAKYVLGLSQGTVSELLSKPKSWDKLTEKGRDSYRKMHAWVWDDQAILLLKTLIPRKGELLRSSSSVKQGTWHLTQPISRDAADPGADDLERADREDRSSEHRINKILSEVNKSHENLLPKFPIPLELTGAGQGLPMPALPPAPGPDDLKLALTFYQAEINQLKKMPSTNPDHFDALAGRPGSRGENVEEESDKEEEERKEEKENQEEDRSRIPAGHASPFSMLQQFPRGPPIFPGGPGFLVSNGLENPLQMMASITNSLVSQPLPTGMTNNAMKMKAVLPPITQQQFDHFSHLNTDQTVSRIKEILSQYSISQRLFGEAVLGLSQGSVSDLLARPKPWHMLTQKGREPFIRMKLFLDDDTAIHKLVASQYKIVPDKLLRQGAYSGKPVMPLVPGMPGMLPAGLQARLGEGFRGLGDGSPLPALIPNSRLPPQILPGIDRSLLSSLPGLGSPRLGLPSSLGLPHLTPNLYEMAALTQEFDTSHITNKVKELLLANNTGQKLFGEAVLGLSQGSVSELLSKPKPWHMLSIKGREPFIRMQLWLNDPANMDKLLAIKKLQEDSRKRKRTFDESFSGKSSPSDISDLYSNPGGLRSPSEEAKRAREGGLDLSFRREEEEASEGEREEEGRPEEEGRDMSESDDGTPRPNGGGRSRRKPAAPQWVNPTDWSGEEHREDMDSKTINGVCVMNTSAVFQPAPDPAD